jgi:uncharacterized ParB-like nuclease family protein
MNQIRRFTATTLAMTMVMALVLIFRVPSVSAEPAIQTSTASAPEEQPSDALGVVVYVILSVFGKVMSD